MLRSASRCDCVSYITVVGGNPAKIIKYRFEPHIIEALQRIKWWDWSLDKIHDNFKYFNDIEKFIALHDKG